MAKQTECNLSNVIKKVSDHLDPNLIDTDPNTSLSTKLRRAQKALKHAKHNTDKLCQQHLDKLLNEAIAANHVKWSQALKYLIRVKKRQFYAWFCHHTKLKAAGGLTFVTVPDPDRTQKPLLECADIEDMLLEHSRLHFATAEGLTFTCKPLKWLLQYDGLMSFGDYVYEGWPLEDTHGFDEPTKAILRNLCNKLLPTNTTEHQLDYKLLMNGIK